MLEYRDVVMYVSHIADDGTQEAVINHLIEVGELAAVFGAEFGSSAAARLIGSLHDIGKYGRGFQRRILANGPKVDHSSVGSWFVAHLLGNGADGKMDPLAYLLAYCIAGHHGGLPNGGSSADDREARTLNAKLRKGNAGFEEIRAGFEPEYPQLDIPSSCTPPEFLQRSANGRFVSPFWVRMLFSCLVDADFLCTERFVKQAERENTFSSLAELKEAFEKNIVVFYPPKTLLNELRCSVLDACKELAGENPGFFSLTVPTGGGKTLASLRFALHHATHTNNGMRRIIYAIPYNTIIEQTADVFRQYLSTNGILEHHSGFDFDFDEEDTDLADEQAKMKRSLQHASENWDAPIVVTSNVQFFDSLFSHKTSKARKLHNIANSVIILDEAQMIPLERMQPCIAVLKELVTHYGCSVVFCTATQPALQGFIEDGATDDEPGVLKTKEICPDVDQLFQKLERVNYRFLGKIENEDLAQRLSSHEQVLCILDNKRQARDVFDLMQGGDAFHLSTLMYPVHRKRVIKEIQARLKDGRPCRVVATSLVEAGVDLDFPVVYRSLSGADSIVQAAGRCNREGKRAKAEATVNVFEPSGDYPLPSIVAQRAGVTRSVIHRLAGSSEGCDVGSPSFIEAYFETLYAMRANAMDKDEVLRRLNEAHVESIPFKDIGNDFSLIDDETMTVIIPCEDNIEWFDELRSGTFSKGLIRKLSKYSVGLYPNQIKALVGSVISPISEGLYLLNDEDDYLEQTGLDLQATGGKGKMW